MAIIINELKIWCALFNVQGAIDYTHISIVKPLSFPKYYYYHKLGGHIIPAQAIVHCKKRYFDLCVGFL